ncbi:transposase IS4 family protein [Pseudomonas fluorescens BRIP34879]|nr:transposase IS4 family protein [Pseudomonas fluorescens BRIP34879]
MTELAWPPRLFDRPKYRQRNIIERMFGWLKENRRIGTRYDKLASSFSHGHAGLQPTLYAAILFLQNLAAFFPDGRSKNRSLRTALLEGNLVHR